MVNALHQSVAEKLQLLVKHWFIKYTPSGIGLPLILLVILLHDNYYYTITIYLVWSNNFPTYSFYVPVAFNILVGQMPI